MNCQFVYPRKIQGRLYPKGKWSVPEEDIKKSGKFFESLVAAGEVFEVAVKAGDKLKTPAREKTGAALLADASLAQAK
jgi:hypothetical protein